MIVEFVYGITPSLKIDKPNHEEFIYDKKNFLLMTYAINREKCFFRSDEITTRRRFLLQFSERVLLQLINL